MTIILTVKVPGKMVHSQDLILCLRPLIVDMTDTSIARVHGPVNTEVGSIEKGMFGCKNLVSEGGLRSIRSEADLNVQEVVVPRVIHNFIDFEYEKTAEAPHQETGVDYLNWSLDSETPGMVLGHASLRWDLVSVSADTGSPAPNKEQLIGHVTVGEFGRTFLVEEHQFGSGMIVSPADFLTVNVQSVHTATSGDGCEELLVGNIWRESTNPE